jgi:hypothetical protein
VLQANQLQSLQRGPPPLPRVDPPRDERQLYVLERAQVLSRDDVSRTVKGLVLELKRSGPRHVPFADNVTKGVTR